MSSTALKPILAPQSAGPPPTGAQSVAAYDLLASEYDANFHRTTRGLEQAGIDAVRAASLAAALSKPDAMVLEVGAGTGVLTEALLRPMRGGHLVFSDPAPGMVARATERLAGMGRSSLAVPMIAGASEMATRVGFRPDVIAAGLADPYLSNALLQALVRIGRRDTRVFVTVPSRRWAVAERQRLGIPIDRTRFRTVEGDEIFSRSLALDAPELRDLFEQSGLRRVESGMIAAEDWIGDPQPEIAWAVGRPMLAACS